MLANGLQRSAMAPGELFLASVAVVYHDHESAFKSGCRGHVCLRLQRSFDALPGFGMDRVAIEEFELFGRRRRPGFHKTAILRADAKRSLRTHNLDRQGIKELVGKDYGWRALIAARLQDRLSGFEVAAQSDLDSLAQSRRVFFQNIAHSPEEGGKLLFRPIQHILREEPAAGAEFSQQNVVRRPQHAPHLVELARQQASENRVHVTRSIKVARFAELRGIARVVAKLGIVKTQLHVTREGNRAAVPDFLFDLFAEGALSPFRWRSARSW